MTEASESFHLDKRLVRCSFDEAATGYDASAVLQREVANRLLERLELIKLVPKVIVDAGAGTGWCSAALARRYRKARVIALDLAPAMVKLAKGRFSPWARRFGGHGFVAGDLERLPLRDASCDLVFSNLALQWCGDLEQTFNEVRRVLRPGGLFMFTTLGPDTLKELRASWAAVDAKIHVNAFMDMHDVGDAMLRARLADPVLDVERITLTYRDVRGLLHDLKGIGAHNVNAGRERGLTGPARLKAMMKAYEAFRSDGLLPATYEVVYGHAWVNEASAEPAGGADGVGIPLQQFRAGLRRQP